LKSIAFVDHSFHIKSRATAFLIQLLKRKYNVDLFWDESWSGKERTDIRKLSQKKYHAIILFQILGFSAEELRKTDCDNIIIIPMYDSVIKIPDIFWVGCGRVKFLNFSRTLHKRMKRIGVVTSYFQYFPEPSETYETVGNFPDLRGFFWQRTADITWSQIRKIIAESNFTDFHLHNATDPPGYKFIQPDIHDIEQFKITTSNWFEKKDDYFNILQNINIFFCSRLHEGIGMSFLEAMAMGKCVVAPNNPTMNEYIKHNRTGYLYNPMNPKPIDFSNSRDISRNAKSYIRDGYRLWKSKEDELIDFIDTPCQYFHTPLWHKLTKACLIFLSHVKNLISFQKR